MTLTPNRCIDNCCDGCGCNVTKEDIGLGNVDNTSDVNKPISTAVQNALSQKASASTVSTLGSNVTALDSRVSAIEGTFVTLGTTQSITGDKTFNGDTEVPNTTLGDTSAKAVNGSRLMAEINNLSGYVTVAGVQAITGDKNFTGDTQFSGDVQMDAVVLVNGTATFASAVTFNGTTRVPNTTIGDTSSIAVNGARLMGELNNYAPMVRTTGAQNISGSKTFTAIPIMAQGVNSKIQIKTDTQQGASTPSVTDIEFYRGNVYTGRLAQTIEGDGSATIDLMIKGNQLAKESRLQIYEDINNSKFVMRFWNGDTWTVLA